MSSFSELQEELVDDLRGVNRFNPGNVEKLERYVAAQLAECQYDREANLSLLKLYQLNPQAWSGLNVAKVLLLAATALPHSDFVLAKCLIDATRPDDSAERKESFDSYIRPALYLGDLLESCQFERAWAFIDGRPVVADTADDIEYDGEPVAPLLVGVAGFRRAVQQFVCHTVSITFQRIDKPLLAQLLGDVDDAELSSICAEHKWTMEKDGTVTVVNQEATVKSRNIEEKVDLSHILDVLRADG